MFVYVLFKFGDEKLETTELTGAVHHGKYRGNPIPSVPGFILVELLVKYYKYRIPQEQNDILVRGHLTTKRFACV